MPSIVPLVEAVSFAASNVMLMLLHALSATTVSQLPDVVVVCLAILLQIVIAVSLDIISME